MDNLFASMVKESSVFKNRDALSPHFIPPHLPFREEQVSLLAKKISPVLSYKKPENIFIYGRTGTGKTAVVKKVLKDLNSFAESKNMPVKGIYINGRLYESEYKILSNILTSLDSSQNPVGLSTSIIYDRILRYISTNSLRLIVAVDEIDTVKGVSNLIYRLNRANDELESGSISIIGISNNPKFKENLDARTRSTLCEVEVVFPPYNAVQLEKILEDRAEMAFKEGVVEKEAISLAAAYAAKHSGDARYALQLLLRAGDLADEEESEKVTRDHVERAKTLVEEDIVYELISTLPDQERLVVLALAIMKKRGKGMKGFGKNVITTGMLYEFYKKIAQLYGLSPVSDRWFREYINDLYTYGIISVTSQPGGMRGNIRVVDLLIDAERTVDVIEKSLKKP